MMYFTVGATQIWLMTVLFCVGLIAAVVAIWWSATRESKAGVDQGEGAEHAEPGVPVPVWMLLLAIFVWALAVSWLVASSGVGI